MSDLEKKPDRFPGQRAVIYARISRDEQGDELGVTRQIAACEEYVAQQGWTTVAVFQDNSRSAFNPKAKSKRTGYLKMIELVESGAVDTIVCWEVDRIFRRNVDLEQVITLVERNPVFLAPIRGTVYDLTTPHGRTMARMLTTIATQESEIKQERIRAAKSQHARLGRVLGGGARPFGYESDRVTIREGEAEWIRYAINSVLDGASMYSIARDLNENGVRTSSGLQWQSARLRSVLLNPRIAGKVQHNGEIVADAVWPAVVDFETWSRAVAILTNPNRRTNEGFTKPKMLSGVARCGLCNHVLRSQPKKGRDGSAEPSYTCRRDLTGGLNGCGKIRIKGDWLDLFVATAVVTALGRTDVLHAAIEMESGRDEIAEEALKRRSDLEAQLARIATLLVEGDLTVAEARSQRNRVNDEKQKIDDQLAVLTARTPLLEVAAAEDVQGHWDALDVDQRRSIIGALLEGVVVHPGRRGLNKPDPSRIELRWRHSVAVADGQPIAEQ